ncbi:TetR/AcrR family transcriptional regulator [Glycomyces sp. A-F 0318]|uniref:TetR/AcrR family transcriptional regulator n=1 Tax=Glycomyces amatae TaxID=2881355 RepID=UPI001E3403D0|nr:TetR/AcrR family transcriptional regulator [Glycomyces amatae]
MTTRRTGLRERKKQATREALRRAALRLALERGPENVRVDDIADAAGVSPRTYNNYFSSREHAIVAAVVEDREERIAAAVAARPATVRLSEAVADAVVEQYTNPGDEARGAMMMITTSPGLRSCYVDAAESLTGPLTRAIIERAPGTDPIAAEVLAAGVGAATKIAVREWLRSGAGDLVIAAGSLPDLIRKALLPLAPALDATMTAPP